MFHVLMRHPVTIASPASFTDSIYFA